MVDLILGEYVLANTMATDIELFHDSVFYHRDERNNRTHTGLKDAKPDFFNSSLLDQEFRQDAGRAPLVIALCVTALR